MERQAASRVSTRTGVGYAIGDLGISIAYFAFGFFFLFYLTDIVGLSAALAGTVILIGRLWDGVNDPLIGILSDRTVSAYGRKRVYLRYGAVPFALSFIVLWWIPAGTPTALAFTIAVTLVLVFATTYSLVGVPYQALVPVMTTDYDERTRLVAFKAVFSAVGTIMGGGIALVVSSQVGVESALRAMAIGFGVFCGIAVLVSSRAVSGFEDRAGTEITPVPLRRYVALAREPNVSTLLGHKALGAVATGVLTAVLPFFALHVVGSGTAASISLAVYTIVAASLVPVWNRLTRRVDKRRLVLMSNGSAAAILAGIGVLASADSLAVFVGGSALLGAAMSAYVLIPPSLVPDLVDWYEYETGERHESVFFGLWMTVHQLGLGVAGFLLGVFLDLFGYVGGADTQSAGAVLGVRLAFAIIPGLFLVLAALLLQRYRITRDRLDEAMAELDRRHTTAVS
jgi:GPH family glycoside/pentoside/hexuronide:cation symporter